MPPFSPWMRFWLSAISAGMIAGTGAMTVALTGDDPANPVQWVFVAATTIGAIGKDIQAVLQTPPPPTKGPTP